MIDKARVKELRKQGLTLQVIADEFGVSRQRISQIVGPAPRPSSPTCVGCNVAITHAKGGPPRKWCSERCRKNTWEAENYRGSCSDCGAEVRKTSVRCNECFIRHHARERQKSYARLVELWNAGHPLKEMAEILETTPGTVSVQMARAKKDGYEFPPRRSGWKGNYNQPGAKQVAPKTRKQVVERMHHAIRYGRLVRPDHCERCGEKCYPDGHHHDYSKPLDVEWLCRSCHIAHHWAERKAAA